MSHLKICASKKQRRDDEVNKKNAVVSNFVWQWATHLDKGFQLLQTSFGDLKHEENIKIHKSSIENWHSCKCCVTKQRSVIEINCNELQNYVNSNSLTSVLKVTKTSKVTQVEQQSRFPKQSKKIIFHLHYNDSSQFKWISQSIYKVHNLWLSIQKTQFLKLPKYSIFHATWVHRTVFHQNPVFSHNCHMSHPCKVPVSCQENPDTWTGSQKKQ